LGARRFSMAACVESLGRMTRGGCSCIGAKLGAGLGCPKTESGSTANDRDALADVRKEVGFMVDRMALSM
jgi:hypothetical protein